MTFFPHEMYTNKVLIPVLVSGFGKGKKVADYIYLLYVIIGVPCKSKNSCKMFVVFFSLCILCCALYSDNKGNKGIISVQFKNASIKTPPIVTNSLSQHIRLAMTDQTRSQYFAILHENEYTVILKV